MKSAGMSDEEAEAMGKFYSELFKETRTAVNHCYQWLLQNDIPAHTVDDVLAKVRKEAEDKGDKKLLEKGGPYLPPHPETAKSGKDLATTCYHVLRHMLPTAHTGTLAQLGKNIAKDYSNYRSKVLRHCTRNLPMFTGPGNMFIEIPARFVTLSRKEGSQFYVTFPRQVKDASENRYEEVTLRLNPFNRGVPLLSKLINCEMDEVPEWNYGSIRLGMSKKPVSRKGSIGIYHRDGRGNKKRYGLTVTVFYDIPSIPLTGCRGVVIFHPDEQAFLVGRNTRGTEIWRYNGNPHDGKHPDLSHKRLADEKAHHSAQVRRFNQDAHASREAGLANSVYDARTSMCARENNRLKDVAHRVSKKVAAFVDRKKPSLVIFGTPREQRQPKKNKQRYSRRNPIDQFGMSAIILQVNSKKSTHNPVLHFEYPNDISVKQFCKALGNSEVVASLRSKTDQFNQVQALKLSHLVTAGVKLTPEQKVKLESKNGKEENES